MTAAAARKLITSDNTHLAGLELTSRVVYVPLRQSKCEEQYRITSYAPRWKQKSTTHTGHDVGAETVYYACF